MSETQDRAESCIRQSIVVEGIVILPKWPEYARRIVGALEGHDRLPWGALRKAFGKDYDGPFGGDLVVRHLVDGGIIERVLWNVDTGAELPTTEWDAFWSGLVSDDAAERARWEAWGRTVGVGYRIAVPPGGVMT